MSWFMGQHLCKLHTKFFKSYASGVCLLTDIVSFIKCKTYHDQGK